MRKLIHFLLLYSLLSVMLYAQDKPTSILFLGDSLTEGFGVSKEDAFPNQVAVLSATKLNKPIVVINGGVSGSTTSDGLARLKWYMKKKPDLVFLALGTNDGLRGLNLEISQENLEEIIRYAQASGAKVILAGMLIPPNYGPEYTERFKNIYHTLEEKYQLKRMPFLLDGVGGEKALNQRDGIHPNEEGHKRIAENVFAFIKEEL